MPEGIRICRESEEIVHPVLEELKDFIFLLRTKEKVSESKGPDNTNPPELFGIVLAMILRSFFISTVSSSNLNCVPVMLPST